MICSHRDRDGEQRPGAVKEVFMKRSILVLVMCSVVVFSGCDRIYRMIQKEGAEELDIIGEVQMNERNEKVAKVQIRLAIFGYGRVFESADGILGPNTRNAIERFQRDNGLKPSRFIDRATWDLLMIFDDCGLIMNDEINTYMVQAALKNAGYDIGRFDGKLGPRSMEKLRQFQQKEGLTPDGRIGWKTLNALMRYLPITEAKK